MSTLLGCGFDSGTSGDGVGGGGDGQGDDGNGNGSGVDAGPNDNICETIALVADALPPRVMILQDLSSSLHNVSDADTTRWDNLKAAMVQVVDTYDTEFALGLVPFSTTILDGGTNDLDCTVNTAHVITPATGNASAIKSKVYGLFSASLVGGTPTHDALVEAKNVLVDQDPMDGSARIAILVTDGAPNCLDGTGDTTSDANKTRVHDKIAELHDGHQIETYVVGYDVSGSLIGTMDGWAGVGGTGTHYAANDTQTLLDQMATIRSALVPCDYTLESPVSDTGYVSVKIDGVGKAFGDTGDGWTLGADDKTITLEGAACATLRDGGAHDLEVTVECDRVIVL